MLPLRIDNFPRAILHIDADAFFASCEQATHPEWKGKPVVTGAERGIVSAASYEAKRLGIGRGTPLGDVKKICPEAIIVASDYETYSLFSTRMFAIIRRFTPLVEEYSIDEAFADITGLQRPLHMNYQKIARTIKETIERELGISVSVGVSISKTLAKLASTARKPSGCVAIPGREIHVYLAETPTINVWGLGSRTSAYCATLGITTALQFAMQSRADVERHFTKPHQQLWAELNGHAVYPLVTEQKRTYASISKMKTFTPASSDRSVVFAQLLKNLENACIKARRYGLAARAMTVMLRTQDFRDVSLCATLTRASAYPHEMTDALHTLFINTFRDGAHYRATNVVLTNLTDAAHVQRSLFESTVAVDRIQRVYAAVDALAARHGKHTVHHAGSLSVHRRALSSRKHLLLPILQHALT